MTDADRHHLVSVAAAIVDSQGRVLAVRRRNGPYRGRWELPGGLLEPGETIYQGLKREVLEETGIAVEPERLTGVYQNMARGGSLSLVFRCHVVTGEPRPTEEAAEVSWLTPTEVLKRMDESRATRLLDGLTTGQPAIRTHDGHSLLHTETQPVAKPH